MPQRFKEVKEFMIDQIAKSYQGSIRDRPISTQWDFFWEADFLNQTFHSLPKSETSSFPKSQMGRVK